MMPDVSVPGVHFKLPQIRLQRGNDIPDELVCDTSLPCNQVFDTGRMNRQRGDKRLLRYSAD